MASSYITDQLPAGDMEKLTITGTASGFTAAKVTIAQSGGFHKRAVRAFVTCETAPCRVRFDGTAPDSSTGHLLTEGDYITIEGEANVANAQFIRTSGTSAELMVTYFYNV